MSERHIRCAGMGQSATLGSVVKRQPDGVLTGECSYCGRQIAITVMRTIKAHKDLRSSEQRAEHWHDQEGDL